jgi:hypothetical protein
VPSALAASDLLPTLVAQFSQPLAFLRELVQNSLDAGTNRVEVQVSYDRPESCAVVEVVDWGEGMDRQIIDSQLTRLFSSSKEGDLTKIGKFGIGFVSVFAVEPRAVVVDTGRSGEYWRVLFHPDRTFDRIARSEPVEGTRVAVYVPMPESRLAPFRQDCRDTLVYWCKHCDVEVCFEGQPVNQPFRLEAPFQVRHEVPGTEVVVAPSPSDRPFFGFYNRGLTLLEGEGSPLPGVAFKVRSRYLEHTLTRDNVLQDDNYRKALAIVEEAAYQRLPDELFRALEESPRDPLLWRLARVVLGYPRPLPESARARRLFPGFGGAAWSVVEMGRSRPVWASQDSPLVQAVGQRGVPVLQPGPSLEVAGRLLGGEIPEIGREWFLPRALPADPAHQALLEALQPLLREAGFPRLALASLEGPPAARVEELGRACPRQGEGDLLALDPAHPLLAAALELAASWPRLAALLAARGALVACGLPVPEDDLLALALRGKAGSRP